MRADCDAERLRLFRLLNDVADDRLVAGARDILTFLEALGVRSQAQHRVTWRRVAYWAEHHGFPLLPGVYGRFYRAAAVTSKFAVLAWLLSRPNNAFPRMFRVAPLWERRTRKTLQDTAPVSSDPLAAQPDADS